MSGDDLSGEDAKRLEHLAALRDRGVIPEDEYRRARQRLLGRRGTADDESGTGFGADQGFGAEAGAADPPPPRRLARFWLVASLLVLALVVLALWFVLARPGGSGGPEGSLGEDLPLNEAVAPLPGPELCESEAIHGRMRDVLFDRAVEGFAGDPGPLESLRRVAAVRIQYPVLRDYDEGIARADCAGRLILDIPPAARDQFQGADALQAEVDYALQPGPGGGDTLVELQGAEVIVQRLVAAATALAEAREAAAARREEVALDCAAPAGEVARMVCADEDLAARDRALADRLEELRDSLPADRRRELAAVGRALVERRARCADRDCLETLYREQSARLEALAGAGPAEAAEPPAP